MPHLRLQGFYDQVANPLLVDVELLYPQDTISDLTQHRHKQYYEGSEIMVAGRIADHKLSSFKADVLAHGVNGGRRWVERSGSAQRLQIHTCSPPLFPLTQASLSAEQCLPSSTMPVSPSPTPRPEHSHTCWHPWLGWNGTQMALISCSPLTKNGSPVTPYMMPHPRHETARGQPLHSSAFF